MAAETDNAEDNTFAESMKVPAFYVDSYYYTYWKGHIRIAFAEVADKEQSWRTAVVMETADVRRLIRDLQIILDKQQAEEKEAAKK